MCFGCLLVGFVVGEEGMGCEVRALGWGFGLVGVVLLCFLQAFEGFEWALSPLARLVGVRSGRVLGQRGLGGIGGLCGLRCVLLLFDR